MAFSVCAMASLTALGFGMFGEGSEMEPGAPPNFPAVLATRLPTSLSASPEGKTSRSTMVPSFPKVAHSQRDSRDETGQQEPQSRNPSLADERQALVSRPSPPLPTKTFRKKEDFETKAQKSLATGEDGNFDRRTAPPLLHSLHEAERLGQGRSLVRKRLYLEAIDVLEPLFSRPPENWDTWFWMGTAQIGVGHYDEAREYFREGLARDETIPELWVHCALAEHQRGKYSQAVSLLRQAELLSPTHPQVHLNLAFTLESQGHASSALRHYRQYLSLTNRNLSYLSTRQKVLKRILNLERS